MKPTRRQAGFAFGALIAAPCLARWLGGCSSPLPATGARASTVEPGEPGTALVVTGSVYALDRVTPVPAATIDVYQTDAGGYYSRPVSDPRRARLRASIRTDGQGRYELATIVPGHYPSRRQAAHIHVHLSAPGVPVHWIDSYLFAGDPFLDPDEVARCAELGTFSPILALRRDADGTLRGRRDVVVDPELADRNRLVDDWYRGE